MTAIATSGADGARLDRGGRIALSGESGFLVFGLVAVGLWLTPGFAAAGDALQVTNARVPASNEVGIDLPLAMTIRNDATEDAGAQLPPEGGTFLRPKDIEAVADYVIAHIKGAGEPTYAECVTFFSSTSRVCDVYKTQAQKPDDATASTGQDQ